MPKIYSANKDVLGFKNSHTRRANQRSNTLIILEHQRKHLAHQKSRTSKNQEHII